MRFPHLLAPLESGRLSLKNRTVFPGHQTLMSRDGVVTAEGVTLRDTLSDAELSRSADAVVMAIGNRVRDDLATALRDHGAIQVRTVGDCVAPRTVTEAVREGRLVGRGLR